MRPIHRAGVDKRRFVLLLTPTAALPHVSEVTVAPISTGRKRFRTQIEVDAVEGVDHLSVVRCESITTILRAHLFERVGEYPDWREPELRDAVIDAFGLIPVFD